jgi:protein TonB
MGCGIMAAAPAAAQVASTVPPKTVEYIAPDGHVLPGPEGADHRLERVYRDSVSGVERIYSAKGTLKMSTPYAHLARHVKLGPQTTFYETGQLHSKEDFVGNQRNGELVVYYPDGQLKRRETYVADKRQAGNCFAPDGSPVAFTEYEVMPTYQGGGQDKITRAIMANVRYPAEALRAQTQGRVFVAFRVGVAGQVEDIKVVKGVSGALDAAAVAAVKKLGLFVPGTQDGEPVAVSFTIPVTFSITVAPPTVRSPNQNTGFGGPY